MRKKIPKFNNTQLLKESRMSIQKTMSKFEMSLVYIIRTNKADSNGITAQIITIQWFNRALLWFWVRKLILHKEISNWSIVMIKKTLDIDNRNKTNRFYQITIKAHHLG